MSKVLQRLDILLFANTAQYRSEMRDTQQSTTTLFEAMQKDAKQMAKVGAAAFAGLSLAGGAMAAALVKDQLVMASELIKIAKLTNSSTEEIQVMTVAAKGLGIEQDALGDIYKDFNEKVGEFLSNGGGGMADFFETIAPRVGATAEEFRDLAGPDGMQQYFNYLEKANISQGEMSFYLESMASDATALIPILQNNGAAVDFWREAMHNAGAVIDDKTIKATKELDASTKLLTLSAEGAKNQFTQALIPALSDVAGSMVSTGDTAEFARQSGELLVKTLKAIAVVGVGVVAVFDTVGSSIAGVAATVGSLMEGVRWYDGAVVASIKMARNLENASNVNMMASQDIDRKIDGYASTINRIKNIGSGATNAAVLQATQYNAAISGLKKPLGETGAAYLEQTKALDAHTAAMKKAQAVAGKAPTLSINSTVKANAEKYNFAALEAKNQLPYGLLSGIHQQESSGNALAVGPATRYGTAKGGFQFLDGTAKQYGVNDPFNMEQAAEGAAKYLKFLLDRYQGNVAKAVAAYNTGEGNVDKHDLSLILSDRWARNKKTGVGQTKEYTQNVLAYTQSVRAAMGENSQFVYDSVSQDAQNMAQTLERQAASRLQIMSQYADEAAKIETKLGDELIKIADAGFNAADAEKYSEQAINAANEASLAITLEKQAYIESQSQKLAAFTDFKTSERDLIERNAQYQRQAVLLDKNLNPDERKFAIDAINEQADLEQANLKLLTDTRYTAAADFRQTELGRIRNQYEYERREILLNLRLTEQQRSEYAAMLDAAEQNDINDVKKNAGSAYQDLTTGLQGTSELNGLGATREDQLQVVQTALDAEILAVDQAAATKLAIESQYYESRRQLITGQMETVANSLSTITGELMGKQSTAFRVMFAVEKGFAIARSIMAIQTGIAQAASLPFPANLGAMISVASATANIISTLQSVRQPAVAGQAHDGLDYVPKEGTYILDAGERVVKPRDNQKLSRFLDAQDTQPSSTMQVSGLKVTVNNYTDATVTTKQNSDGELELKIINTINKQVPAQLSNPSSAISRSLKNNWQTAPRR